MARELGVGIIGCGNISTTYFGLAPLFKGLKVLACTDINMNAAEIRAEEYGVKAQPMEELLANDELDIIVNLTIPAAHFPVSKAILEAGKHVYSEKPLVLSLETGRRVEGHRQCQGLVRRLRAGHLPRRCAPACPQFHR
jgi:Predicted dehydrogenases and related proteins